MRIADPAELKPPVESVAAFRFSDALAEKLGGAEVDPYSAAGPVRLSAIRLTGGLVVGVVIHEHGGFAEILTQVTTDIERILVETLRTLGVSSSEITWMRDGVDASAIIAALENGSADHPDNRTYRVELAPHFETAAREMLLTSSESQALLLLIMRVMTQAELGTRIGQTDIRMLRVPQIVLGDGSEVAPLALFYSVDDARRIASIVDVQRLASSDVLIGPQSYFDAVIRELAGRGFADSIVREDAAKVFPHHPRTVAATVLDIGEILRRAS